MEQIIINTIEEGVIRATEGEQPIQINNIEFYQDLYKFHNNSILLKVLNANIRMVNGEEHACDIYVDLISGNTFYENI